MPPALPLWESLVAAGLRRFMGGVVQSVRCLMPSAVRGGIFGSRPRTYCDRSGRALGNLRKGAIVKGSVGHPFGGRCIHGKEGARLHKGSLVNDHCGHCKQQGMTTEGRNERCVK